MTNVRYHVVECVHKSLHVILNLYKSLKILKNNKDLLRFHQMYVICKSGHCKLLCMVHRENKCGYIRREISK